MFITRSSVSVTEPKLLLIVYESSSMYSDNPEYMDAEEMEDKYYIELATIRNGQIGEAKPISSEGIRNIRNVFAPKGYEFIRSGTLINRNLIYFNTSPADRLYIWHRPAQPTHFNHVNEKFCGIVNMPNLLFVMAKGSLSVYAVKTSNIKASTKLFFSPLPNNMGNKICMGTARGKKSETDIMKYITSWEDAYLKSNFSDHGADIKMLTEIVGSKKPFPTSKLKPVKDLTVEKLIRKNETLHYFRTD